MKALCCLECKKVLKSLSQYKHETNGLVIEGYCEDCHQYSRWKVKQTRDDRIVSKNGAPLWHRLDYYLYEQEDEYMLYIPGDMPIEGTLDEIRQHLKDSLGDYYPKAVKDSILEEEE